MFRAKWSTIVAAALSCCGPVLAQQALPAPNVPRVVTIQEEGKPAMQCRVLKTWKTGASDAFEVESLTTGERITLVESGPLSRHSGGGKVVQEVRSHIYHWVHNTRPSDAPMARRMRLFRMPKSQAAGTAVKPVMLPTSSGASGCQVTPAVNTQPTPALATVTPVVRTAAAPGPAPAGSVVRRHPFRRPCRRHRSRAPPPPRRRGDPDRQQCRRRAREAQQLALSWGKASDHKSERHPHRAGIACRARRPHAPKEDLPQAKPPPTRSPILQSSVPMN